jgi:OOP family OmpA-OmpF porin
VEGHTDDVGSEEYNRELSRERAQSVHRYLLGQGVPPERLDAVVGYGESRPVASNDTSEGRQRNRRVEIVFEEAAPLVSGIPERR